MIKLLSVAKTFKRHFYNFFKWESHCFREFGYKSNIRNPRCSITNKKSIEIGDYTYIDKFARIDPVIRWNQQRFTPLIKIGSKVLINQNFHCTCAESIIIGDRTAITANCSVFDIIHPYENIQLSPATSDIIVDPVKIGNDCIIGMNSVIMPGTVLGIHCVVGANSVVKGIFPDYSVIVGSPAKIIKRYNPKVGKWEKTNPDGSFFKSY